MAYLAVIDQSACVAHGDCEELAPDVFRVEDVTTVVGTAPLEQLVSVAQSCPVEAISVIDEETGEQVHP
ncbi:MAG TPA: ferredoxin [Solirubrobacteraceae bacterium]|nr:ferredoxin [Solirubrobacteraceae bacterium]